MNTKALFSPPFYLIFPSSIERVHFQSARSLFFFRYIYFSSSWIHLDSRGYIPRETDVTLVRLVYPHVTRKDFSFLLENIIANEFWMSLVVAFFFLYQKQSVYIYSWNRNDDVADSPTRPPTRWSCNDRPNGVWFHPCSRVESGWNGDVCVVQGGF